MAPRTGSLSLRSSHPSHLPSRDPPSTAGSPSLHPNTRRSYLCRAVNLGQDGGRATVGVRCPSDIWTTLEPQVATGRPHGHEGPHPPSLTLPGTEERELRRARSPNPLWRPKVRGPPTSKVSASSSEHVCPCPYSLKSDPRREHVWSARYDGGRPWTP